MCGPADDPTQYDKPVITKPRVVVHSGTPREDPLVELRALSDAATPGLWWSRPGERGVYPDSWMRPGRTDVEFDPDTGYAKGYGGVVTDAQEAADAALIAAAVNYVRSLLADVR